MLVLDRKIQEGFWIDGRIFVKVISIGRRRVKIGIGVPSAPRISIGGKPDDDIILITTSEGEVLTLEPPLRDEPKSGLMFWRQLF